MSGKLLKSVLTLSIFKKSVQDFMIYKDDVPTYAITQFKPLRNKQIVIGAFGNINKIRVYILRPIFISFFEIERPDCYDESCVDIPDISFGWGCEPFENEEDYIPDFCCYSDDNQRISPRGHTLRHIFRRKCQLDGGRQQALLRRQ